MSSLTLPGTRSAETGRKVPSREHFRRAAKVAGTSSAVIPDVTVPKRQSFRVRTMHDEVPPARHGQDARTDLDGCAPAASTADGVVDVRPPHIEGGELAELRVKLDLAQLDHPSRWAKLSR